MEINESTFSKKSTFETFGVNLRLSEVHELMNGYQRLQKFLNAFFYENVKVGVFVGHIIE